MGSGAGLGGCHACIKYLMFAFNFIFWLIGCALVGLGIWVLVDDKFKELASDSSFVALQYAGVALIVVGSIIMVIGFFGCCGAIRESQCLLVMFFICMFILFAGLVGAGIYWLLEKDTFIDEIKQEFSKQFEKKVQSDDSSKDGKETVLLDLVQGVFKCCGEKSEAQYTIRGVPKPESCPDTKNTKEIVVPGCHAALEEQLGNSSVILAGVAIGAGVTMLLGMIFSMLLCCAIRDADD